MRRAALLALALLAAPATAQGISPPQPYLDEGETIEVQLALDLNDDGLKDLAYVAVQENRRRLTVVSFTFDEDWTADLVSQTLALDPYPLGDAVLKLKGNVLLFEELTGGTTAVFSTHRFRWDNKLAAMRLIGLDATLYSRTFAHDGVKASWNLLTGDFTSHTLKLRGGDSDIAYDEVDKKRKKKRSAPVRLEQSPTGDDLLGWPGGS